MAQKKKQPKTELTERKNKWFSRKFIVWFTATIFMAVAMIMNMHNPDNELAAQFMTWWGMISLAYIGGNVYTDYLTKGAK